MDTKITNLIKHWKPDFVFTSIFMKEQNINYDLQL